MRLRREKQAARWEPPKQTPEEQELVERLSALTATDELTWTTYADLSTEWLTKRGEISYRLTLGSVVVSDAQSRVSIPWTGDLHAALWAQRERHEAALLERAAGALA